MDEDIQDVDSFVANPVVVDSFVANPVVVDAVVDVLVFLAFISSFSMTTPFLHLGAYPISCSVDLLYHKRDNYVPLAQREIITTACL